MFKRFTSVLISLTLIFSALPFSVSAAVTTLYVSPDGSDSNLGTQESPLASMEGARKRVATLRENGTYINEVIFRGGDYRIKETVKFTEADSGKDGDPIVYRAYEGEIPRFKGSVGCIYSISCDG